MDSQATRVVRLVSSLTDVAKLKSYSTSEPISVTTAFWRLSSIPMPKVIAFEPVPQLYDRLVRNVELNHLGSRIKAMNLAVSDRCDEIPLYVPNNGVLCESSTLAGFRPDSMQLRAEATTVDTFLQAHGVGSVDLIKIDVEGAEHLVFEGMWKTRHNLRGASRQVSS